MTRSECEHTVDENLHFMCADIFELKDYFHRHGKFHRIMTSFWELVLLNAHSILSMCVVCVCLLIGIGKWSRSTISIYLFANFHFGRHPIANEIIICQKRNKQHNITDTIMNSSIFEMKPLSVNFNTI